jgi:hypothetical protein
MYPEVIRFKELTINPKDILQHRKLKNKPIPLDWVRCDFPIPSTDFYGAARAPLVLIDDWIETNILGRWTSYSTADPRNASNTLIVVYFESATDAVFFKLSGGEAIWKEVS